MREWWGEPNSRPEVEADLLGDAESALLVLDVGGAVAGGIQYHEETHPMYRHAGIDVFVATGFQGRGIGTEAVRLVAGFLFEQRGHHRLTIDPAAANVRAIRCYEKVGFRRVGVLRRYERTEDGTFRDGLLLDLLPDELRS